MKRSLDCVLDQIYVTTGERIKFWKLMNVPLKDISDSDLEWASKQDHLNSHMSKKVFLAEIERRKS